MAATDGVDLRGQRRERLSGEESGSVRLHDGIPHSDVVAANARARGVGARVIEAERVPELVDEDGFQAQRPGLLATWRPAERDSIHLDIRFVDLPVLFVARLAVRANARQRMTASIVTSIGIGRGRRAPFALLEEDLIDPVPADPGAIKWPRGEGEARRRTTRERRVPYSSGARERITHLPRHCGSRAAGRKLKHDLTNRPV